MDPVLHVNWTVLPNHEPPLLLVPPIDSLGRPMTRVRAAFTLTELLVVVVIVGILAAIAIPKFHGTKEKTSAAALRSDLRNLALAEEAYFFDKQVYTSDTALLNYRVSPGVEITLTTPPSGGWVATATHRLPYPLQCTVFVGPMTPPPPTQNEGVPACQ
jgi:prepilin-type N-terminal cleavage/methylation domain-containing protein